ncbi:MAG: hypothetical protein ACE5JG_03780 [Planctomycetota bacterium]
MPNGEHVPGEVRRSGLATKTVLLLMAGAMVGGLGGGLVGGLVTGGDGCPPCWPNYQCPVPGQPYASAYQVLQMIRGMAHAARDAGTINEAKHRQVMEALLQCASDINPFGDLQAHCQKLQSAFANAQANKWDDVIKDLEAGH